MNASDKGDIGERRRVNRFAVLLGAGMLLFMGALVLIGMALVRGREADVAVQRHYDEASLSIAVLADGNVVFAPDGSLGRSLTDWLEGNDGQPRSFEIGRGQFVGDTVEPVRAAQDKLPGLIRMLNAYPRVAIELIGLAPRSGRHADERVAQSRAEWLREYLVRNGVERGRVSVTTTDHVAGATSAAPTLGNRRDDRLVLRLIPG